MCAYVFICTSQNILRHGKEDALKEGIQCALVDIILTSTNLPMSLELTDFITRNHQQLPFNDLLVESSRAGSI